MADNSRPTLRFGRAVCGDLTQAERREWWLGNGLGGYAAGTIAGTLTRRYHGLLIAPLNPRLGRHLVLVKADAALTLEDHDARWPLAANRWSDGSIAPAGYRHIESFTLDGRMPVWRYAYGDVIVEQRLWLEPGANTVYLAWRAQYPGPERALHLTVNLLANARDHHGESAPWQFHPVIEPDHGTLVIRQPGGGISPAYALRLQVRGGTLASRQDWYWNFDLPVERERGLGDRDHHLCVAEATLRVDRGDWCGLVASLESDASPDLEEAMRRFHAYDQAVLQRARLTVSGMDDAPDWIEQMLLAADGFFFARPLPDLPEGESVIAGYPWFGDWGRDTMIALPGLTLATGRYASARGLLSTFARFVQDGLLPNWFPGAGETPAYNTADAALWFIEAWRAYVATTGDHTALAEHVPVLQSIVAAYRNGTRYGIAVDPADGLLRAGEPGVQLTWMDAKVGDWVVTPRQGKAVELNALWHNALCTMAELTALLRRDGRVYLAAAAQTRTGFQRFLRPTGGLYDVLDGPDGADRRIRPNQLLAVSLYHSPLDAGAQARVVQECGRCLATSYGLRSLDPADPDYRPRYQGDVRARDGAYHQGPAWGWLVGHYALARYRIDADADAALAVLEPLRDHLADAGLGTISEIFDGDPPHEPRGAPAQAWSVAGVLEAWWRLTLSRGGMAIFAPSMEPPNAASHTSTP